MKTKAIILAMSLVLLMSTSVIADVPDQITYQGRLLYNGSPVTSATNITFRLYDAESGTLRWTQGPQSVTPDNNGIYTVILGSVGNQIPDDYDELWLELVVAGNTLTPRKKLTSTPFVLRAGELPNLYVSGNVGIGTTSPGVLLHAKGTGHQYIEIESDATSKSALFMSSDGTNLVYSGLGAGHGGGTAGNWIVYAGGTRMSVTQGGNVGIGTTGPGYLLDVNGTASVRVGTNQRARFTSESSIVTLAGVNDPADAFVGFKLDGNPLVLNAQSNGNVGIGTTTPGETLEVNGNVKMGWEKISNNCVGTNDCIATCTPGKYLLGGGCKCNGCGSIRLWGSYPDSDTVWKCSYDSAPTSIDAYAFCANIR